MPFNIADPDSVNLAVRTRMATKKHEKAQKLEPSLYTEHLTPGSFCVSSCFFVAIS